MLGLGVAASPNSLGAFSGLKKSLVVGLAVKPSMLLARGEWLAYARELGRFISVSKKLTLPKNFLKGIDRLYLEVQAQLGGK